MFREIKAPSREPSVTVVAIVKNEMFFLPAFLDHYRRQGIEQFVFLDDGSVDGGLEYLQAQNDCAIIASHYRYGDYVDGKRVDVIWRNMLPRTYCAGRWAILVDVDELLQFPVGFDSAISFTAAIERLGHTAVGATMIDFYPAHVDGLSNAEAPASAAELIGRYPYFDNVRHGHWVDGENRYHRVYGGVRDRLLRTHGMEPPQARATPLRLLKQALRSSLGLKRDKNQFFNALKKVPLIKWSEPHEYVTSHAISKPPASGTQLPLMHFKFTGSLAAKIDAAIATGSYSNKSAEYHLYRALLLAMRDSGNGSFLCADSREFRDKSDFIENGLLRFDAGSEVRPLAGEPSRDAYAREAFE